MKKITAILLSVFSLTLNAADFENCLITEVVVAGPNNAHVNLNCSISERPACAIAGSYFGFDKSTDEGKTYLSIILTAFASGSPISGYVNDTNCSPHQGNVALLTHLRMKK